MLKSLMWRLITGKRASADEINNFPIETGTISYGVRIPIVVIDSGEKCEECLLYVHGAKSDVIKIHSYLKMLHKLFRIDVASFDPIGFGTTQKYKIEPTEETISDNVKDTLEYLKDRGYTKIYIFAESLGCAMYMVYVRRYKDMTNKIVLLNPLNDPISWLNLHTMGIKLDHLKKLNFADDMVHYTEPILMIASDNDMFISTKQIKQLWDKHKKTLVECKKEPYKLIIVKNATHVSTLKTMGYDKFRDETLNFYRGL